MRTSRWPLPHGFIRKVNFSSSSSIVKAPGCGPVPLVEWARQVAASAWTMSRRSRAAIVSTSRFQPRPWPDSHASATASSPKRSCTNVIRPPIPSTIRSWR
jgi:hypothetical protein